jgi:uncharacterized protein YceH (UPF0502 family)
MTDAPISDSTPSAIPTLSPVEARILGSLIEKAAITPDVYPLTVNATVQACNQKTSREPVMHLEPGEVEHTLRAMLDRGLVKLDPFSQRAARYSHNFDGAYGTTARQRAALCLMLLRGPQTLNEVFTRCERLTDFPSLDDVRDTLERLMERDAPLVVRIPRGHGQREDRYMHLLSGRVDVDAFAESAAASTHPATGRKNDAELSERVTALESEVAALKEQLASLLSSR